MAFYMFLSSNGTRRNSHITKLHDPLWEDDKKQWIKEEVEDVFEKSGQP